MTIEIHNLDKKATKLIFGFITESVPDDVVKQLEFSIDQKPEGNTFDICFKILKPFIHITLYENRFEIENYNSVCKIPVTEFSHIKIF